MESDQVQEIKSKIDIVELIQSYLPLTKGGKNYKAVCPFHSEKTPSFMVSPQLGIFKCFGCGKAGDAFTFVQEIEGVDFPEALKMLADRAGVKLTRVQDGAGQETSRKQRLYEINHLAEEFFHFLLTKHKFGETAREYLKKRQVSEETTKTFKLGYSPNSWDSLGQFLLGKNYLLEDIIASGLALPREGDRRFYDRFRARIMFPYHDTQGRVIGFSARILTEAKDQPKYINTPQTEIFDKGTTLYGIDLAKTEIKKKNEAIVVEGQMDVVTPHQAGFRNIIASGGTSLTQNQLRLLSRYTKNLSLNFDMDFAGDAASLRGIELAQELEINIKVITLPKEIKDADEAVKKDPSTFKNAIENAKLINDFFFESALSKFDAKSPIGKKEIAAFLLPKIAKIKNEIEKNHYIKWLAEEIDTEEAILYKELGKLDGRENNARVGALHPSTGSGTPLHKPGANIGEYILSLLLKAPLDLAQKTLHKLGQNDFTEPPTLEIFNQLKDYLEGREKKLEIDVFKKRLSETAQAKLNELWLADLEDLEIEENQEVFAKELDTAFAAIKKQTLKRELSDLTKKIKAAEKEANEGELKDLQNQFTALSEKLK